MNLYETTFIVNPESDDAVIDEQVKAVSQLISKNGGKIVREDRMGTRRLAYPINNHYQGYYATFLFEAEPPVLRALDRHMKLGEAYIRHMTIRFEGEPEEVFKEKPDFGHGHRRKETDREARVETTVPDKPVQAESRVPDEKPVDPDDTAEIAITKEADAENSTEAESEREEL